MLHTEHSITSKGEQANFVTSGFYNQYETNTIIAIATSNYSSEKTRKDHRAPSTTATSNITPLKDSQVTLQELSNTAPSLS